MNSVNRNHLDFGQGLDSRRVGGAARLGKVVYCAEMNCVQIRVVETCTVEKTSQNVCGNTHRVDRQRRTSDRLQCDKQKPYLVYLKNVYSTEMVAVHSCITPLHTRMVSSLYAPNFSVARPVLRLGSTNRPTSTVHSRFSAVRKLWCLGYPVFLQHVKPSSQGCKNKNLSIKMCGNVPQLQSGSTVAPSQNV